MGFKKFIFSKYCNNFVLSVDWTDVFFADGHGVVVNERRRGRTLGCDAEVFRLDC